MPQLKQLIGQNKQANLKHTNYSKELEDTTKYFQNK